MWKIKVLLRIAFWTTVIVLVAPEQSVEALKSLGEGAGMVLAGAWELSADHVKSWVSFNWIKGWFN
ncbi:hypothetical protein D3C80_1686820 [compost metagenome]